jgi:hypothetical protein
MKQKIVFEYDDRYLDFNIDEMTRFIVDYRDIDPKDRKPEPQLEKFISNCINKNTDRGLFDRIVRNELSKHPIPDWVLTFPPFESMITEWAPLSKKRKRSENEPEYIGVIGIVDNYNNRKLSNPKIFSFKTAEKAETSMWILSELCKSKRVDAFHTIVDSAQLTPFSLANTEEIVNSIKDE